MRVVIVSPFPTERNALEELLRWEGYEVSTAADLETGLALASTQRPEVVIAEAQAPGLDGLALARELTRRGFGGLGILMCQRAGRIVGDPDLVCLTKPIDLAQLFRLVASRAPAKSRVA